jgi:hypothetical protein
MEFRIAIWAAAASRCWCVGCLFLGDKQGHSDTADCVHPGPVNVRHVGPRSAVLLTGVLVAGGHDS